jgi:hypothetical protein
MNRLRLLAPAASLALAMTLALFASQCGGDGGSSGGTTVDSGGPPGPATGTVRLSVRSMR